MSEEPLKFQTMNSVKSNTLSMKYQGLRPLGCKDIGIRNSEFLARKQLKQLLVESLKR